MDLKGRDFLKLLEFTTEEITYLVDLEAELKEKKTFLLQFSSLFGMIEDILLY